MSKEENSRAIKLDLKYPVEYGERTISFLSFARPKGKHIKHLGSDIKMEQLVVIASKVVEDDAITPAFFDQLDALDYLKVTEIIGSFLDDGPKIGKMP